MFIEGSTKEGLLIVGCDSRRNPRDLSMAKFIAVVAGNRFEYNITDTLESLSKSLIVNGDDPSLRGLVTYSTDLGSFVNDVLWRVRIDADLKQLPVGIVTSSDNRVPEDLDRHLSVLHIGRESPLVEIEAFLYTLIPSPTQPE